MKHDDTSLGKSIAEFGLVLGPLEWVSQKILHAYRISSFFKVSLALLGGAAVVVAVLDLVERRNDRLLRDLNLFIHSKGETSARSSAALLRSLIERGMAPASIPLSGVNLVEVDLSNSDLRDVYLTEAKLQLINLSGSQLDGAVFNESYLNSADLSNSSLVGASFTLAKTAGIDLTGSDLTEAEMDGAFMFAADLTDAKLVDASLTGVQLGHATLRRTNFTDASFLRAGVTEADLREAILVNAHLVGADFTGSDLEGANVSGATFESYEDDGSIVIDENGRPSTAVVTPSQLSAACASPNNPPLLPKGPVFQNIDLQPCQ